MNMNRRDVLKAGALAAGGAAMLQAGSGRVEAYSPTYQYQWDKTYSGGPYLDPLEPGLPGKHYNPVIVPGGYKLPWKIVDGVKVYHLIAEEVHHEFAPGLKARCWGYNGTVNGPVIEAVEGDRVRIYVTNKTIAPTSIHWHGVFFHCGQDGVGGLTQGVIHPGETFKYEWTWKQHGTFMFHSHHDEMTQIGLGQTGMIVVHPRTFEGPRPDRDFALMLHEYKITAGTARPDPNEMTDFNVLTINGKSFPATGPLVTKRNDRVRIRIGNLGPMDHHPIHLHGYYFKIVETDGGQIPPSAQWPETTVLCAVGQTRTIELITDEPGDWAMHCHMTHHVMNQMGHGLPNMIGVNPDGLDELVTPLLPEYMTMGQDGMGEHGIHIEKGHMRPPDNSIPMVGGMGPFDYITMGGMFTILKVRESLPEASRNDPEWNEDPGWFEHPNGTVASKASPAEIQRDIGS